MEISYIIKVIETKEHSVNDLDHTTAVIQLLHYIFGQRTQDVISKQKSQIHIWI